MNNGLKTSLGILLGAVAGIAVDETTFGKSRRDNIKKLELQQQKMNEFYMILLQWLRVHQEGRTLAEYFRKNGYSTVAVYGMKELGEALVGELEKSDVDVKYCVDRSADDIYVEVDVYKPDQNLPPVDVMVVTAVHYFEDIENDMMNKVDCPIISLEDVVWEA